MTAVWMPLHGRPDLSPEIIKLLLILRISDLWSCLQGKSWVESVLSRMERPDGLGGRVGEVVAPWVCSSYRSEQHALYLRSSRAVPPHVRSLMLFF